MAIIQRLAIIHLAIIQRIRPKSFGSVIRLHILPSTRRCFVSPQNINFQTKFFFQNFEFFLRWKRVFLKDVENLFLEFCSWSWFLSIKNIGEMRGTVVSVVATATTNNSTKIIFYFFKWHWSVWQSLGMCIDYAA